MRTSHITIRRQIENEKLKITDRELFSSKPFSDYLTDIAETASKRYKRKIKVMTYWDDKPDARIAYTDNEYIFINAGNRITRSFPARKLRTTSIVGLNAHEIGHVLYTDFALWKEYLESLQSGLIYPNEPNSLSETDRTAYDEIKDIYASGNKTAAGAISRAADNIENILDDAYTESRMCADFPGVFKTGIIMNRKKMAELSWDIETQINNGHNGLTILLNMFIQYCITNDRSLFGSHNGEYLDVFNECVPFIDKSMYSGDSKIRYDAVNHIIVKLWRYIKPLIDEAEEEQKKTMNASDKTLDELFAKLGSMIIGSGSRPSGKGNSIAGVIELPHGSVTPENTGMPVTRDPAENMAEKIAEEKVYNRLEKELSEKLQKEADTINSGGNSDVKIRIIRKSGVTGDMVQKYHEVSPPLLVLSKRLQKQVSQILKDKREGGKLTGLYMGKRMNANSFVRNDGRIFYNNRLPEDNPDIAVALLVDESGSMWLDNRISSAREASIILHDFCVKLDIPVIVYGHSTSYDDEFVELYAYAEFDSYDKKDAYRLMDISDKDNNRDGTALRFVAERLVRRSEKIKLLINISDGQPNAKNYYGAEVEADIRGIKREYTNKGVTVFTAAIGDDKENIKRIYGDGYLDITDLNRLPVNLTSLISRYIK